MRELERLLRNYAQKQRDHLLKKMKSLILLQKILNNIWVHANLLKMIAIHENQVGITNGLAWTAYGGEMIKIEAVIMPGKGKLILTGHLAMS